MDEQTCPTQVGEYFSLEPERTHFFLLANRSPIGWPKCCYTDATLSRRRVHSLGDLPGCEKMKTDCQPSCWDRWALYSPCPFSYITTVMLSNLSMTSLPVAEVEMEQNPLYCSDTRLMWGDNWLCLQCWADKAFRPSQSNPMLRVLLCGGPRRITGSAVQISPNRDMTISAMTLVAVSTHWAGTAETPCVHLTNISTWIQKEHKAEFTGLAGKRSQ